uniref:Uncharacterized protein n=1 Tax=Panagrolaimus sp. JU765 TaxID=591449 RepID=A0AC34RLR9_9BILA
MLWESNKQFDELTLILTDFVKRRALEAILARLQAVVRTRVTGFTYSPIDDSIKTWLLSFGMQLCGTAYVWKNNAATLMHMYKAVGPTGVEVMFGISNPEDKNRELKATPLKTGLDPEFSTSTFPVYGIILIVVGIVTLLAILITILYCKVVKPRMAKKNDPTTKDLEANVQGKPQTTASSKQEERKATEPVQKPVPPLWPVVVNEHVKTEEKSWIDSAKHNVLRERKEKMERRNALEREQKER